MSSCTFKSNDSDKTTDNGVDIDWEVKSAPNDLQLPGRQKNIIKVDTIYKPVNAQKNIVFELIRNQGQDANVLKTLDIEKLEIWNTGQNWNAGLKWPGTAQAVATTFINRNAEVVQVRYRGDTDVELIGYRVHFELTEN